MNIYLFSIAVICHGIARSFALTPWNALVGRTDGDRRTPSYQSSFQPQRVRRDTHYQSMSVPTYRLNYNPVQTSLTFCSFNPPPYPLKSIIVSNLGSITGVTLSTPNQPRSILNTAQARGLLLVFNNPPTSQCYLLNFPPTASTALNNVNVQFIYDFNTNTNPVACGSSVCQNGGVCQYTGTNGYQCQCDSSNQWLGVDCSKLNPCSRTPCNNDGQCYYLPDATYYCICSYGFSGNNCQFSMTQTTATTPSSSLYNNPCLSSHSCLNGGTCVVKGTQGEFTCTCPQGYTGTNCQTMNYFPTMTTTTTSPSNTCGIAPSKPSLDYEGRIINGQSVYNYNWPWLVSLQTVSGGSHFCGGTLIDAYHVITAAHCFDTSSVSPSMFKVVAGLLNLQQTYVAGVQQFAIERIFRHEQYSSTALVNDIAIIKLRTAAQFNSAVYPICLPNGNGNQDPRTSQNVQIAGWGYTNSATKQLAQQLQQATIQILDMNADLYGGPGCNTWARQGYSISSAQQICAMSRDTRTDSCQGDSGGPLIRNIGSQWFLFGIVSYGDTICASSKAAGVYTRVSAYSAWIQQKLQL